MTDDEYNPRAVGDGRLLVEVEDGWRVRELEGATIVASGNGEVVVALGGSDSVLFVVALEESHGPQLEIRDLAVPANGRPLDDGRFRARSVFRSNFALSGNSQRLAMLDREAQDVRIWDAPTGELRERFSVLTREERRRGEAASEIALDAKGSMMAVNRESGSVDLWRLGNPRVRLGSLKENDLANVNASPARPVAFAPDGSLAVLYGGGLIALWDLSALSLPAKELAAEARRATGLEVRDGVVRKVDRERIDAHGRKR